MASITWGPELAEVYDQTYAAQSAPAVLEPMVELLAELAQGGPALEFAAGTGRIALPLAARGIAVRGIELSPHMAERMIAKPGADAVPVTIGDMTSIRVPGAFRLMYLVANTIMNVTTQDDRRSSPTRPRTCSRAAASWSRWKSRSSAGFRQARPDGCSPLDADHLGIETFDDTAAQIAWSHHWMDVQGRFVRHSAPYRYAWPSELDLMAKISGFRVRDRWAGWDQAPFTASSESQVAVFEKLLPAPARH